MSQSNTEIYDGTLAGEMSGFFLGQLSAIAGGLMAKGTVTICIERCKGCELCIHACPQKVLRLSDRYNRRGYRSVMIDEQLHACTGCGLCAVICPDAVFTVFREASKRGPAQTG